MTDVQDLSELENIKLKVENMDKMHHLEILKILKKYPQIKLNENKNGVFVNLSFLSKETIEEINKYIDYISDQEKSISLLEIQKEDVKNTYFIEKGDKDNMILYNSINK
jgi:hypothetical protein